MSEEIREEEMSFEEMIDASLKPCLLYTSVRPIPEDDDFFENVWRAYRQDGNIG